MIAGREEREQESAKWRTLKWGTPLAAHITFAFIWQCVSSQHSLVQMRLLLSQDWKGCFKSLKGFIACRFCRWFLTPSPHCFLGESQFSIHVAVAVKHTPKNWQLCRLWYSLLACESVIQIDGSKWLFVNYNIFLQHITSLRLFKDRKDLAFDDWFYFQLWKRFVSHLHLKDNTSLSKTLLMHW